MIDFRRDPTDDRARLRCDGCRRKSSVLSFGDPRIAFEPAIFAWLRQQCRLTGWDVLPSRQDGECRMIDVCPRCAAKVRKIARNPWRIEPWD